MTILDTLITEYKAEDKATAAVERIAKANERLHSIIQSVVGGLAALGAVQAAMDLKTKAEEAASAYISLEARLKALVGTAEAARRKLHLAEIVAGPSPFTTKQLADAAVTLEAFRVNSERALPTIGKLGAAMGAGDEQIQMFTRAIGQLAQGNFIDADVLASMGLTRSDFRAKGVKFDGSGALKSSAVEALTALEKIVNERFGKVLDEMANTPESKRAALEDAGEKVYRSIGMGLLKAQGPFVDSLTKVVTALTNSGIIDEIVNKLTGAFTSVFGGDSSEALTHFIAKVLAFLNFLPEKITKVFEVIKSIGQTLESFFVKLVNTIGNAITGLINMLRTAAAEVANQFGPFIGPLMGKKFEHVDPKPLKFDPITGIGDVFGRIGNTLFGVDDKQRKKEQEFEARLLKAMQMPGAVMPDNSKLPFLNGKQEQVQKQQEALEKIASATERTADNTKIDVRELLFGGGERGRSGVSMLDISPRVGPAAGPYNDRGPRKIEVKASQGATALEKGIVEVVRQNLPTVLRSLGYEVSR